MGVIVKPPPIVGALRFGAAVTDELNIAHATDINLTPASVFSWLALVRITTFTAARFIWSKNEGDGNGGPAMLLNGTEEVVWRFSMTATTTTCTTSNLDIQLGRWFWIGATYDGSDSQRVRVFSSDLSIRSHIREATYASYTAGSGSGGTSNSTAPMRIGNNGNGGGALANAIQGDVAFFVFIKDQRLRADEFELIREQFTLNPRRIRSRIWMPLTGGTVRDHSGFQHHGTIAGLTPAPAPITIPVKRLTYKKPLSEGVFSASGTGTATFVGASTAEAPLSAAGTGTATFVGASTASSPLSASGTGTATFVGASTTEAPLTASGTGTATFVGASTAESPLSAAGTGTATFVGESSASSPLTASGTGTATFVGASTAEAPLSTSGTGTATFVGAATASSPLSASGAGTATFVGAATASSPLSAAGVGTATFTSPGVTEGVLDAAGTSTVTFVGASTASSPMTASGTATVTFTGSSIGGALNRAMAKSLKTVSMGRSVRTVRIRNSTP